MDFFIGGLSAAGASLFSNPLDVLKTRMQLQGELQARGQHAVHYRNVFHAAVVVVKNDGVSGLQKGLGAAIFMHFIRNSIRLGSYQYLVKQGMVTDDRGKTIFWRSALASAATGAAGAFFGSPLFLIKTQLQSQAAKQIAVGHQHHHTGTLVALKQIYHTYGVKGLWRGGYGTMLRAVFGSSAQLTSFAMSKDVLSQYDLFKSSPLLTSFVASVMGGFFQTAMITPFDLISTRIYNQPVDINGKGLLYTGIIDCFVKIWRTEGVLGFYKGVGAIYMRLAPHGALCLVFWDLLKDAQSKYIQ
ncbi:solute carrier family 25 member 35-like [Atheta coriaria]|uniref:solute carrier family 25 member 35-like n=1 Tax=Dalotia coriaria TaxID=877792 RepID=UPI0031F41A33